MLPQTSSTPGQWRTSAAEYQRQMMDVVGEPDVEVVVYMTSAQIGKTEIINNIGGYYMDLHPSPILMVLPTVDVAEKFSKERLQPAIEDSPRLRNLVAPSKSRDSSNTLSQKMFPGGFISIVGANAPTGLAYRSIRLAMMDEVDRFPHSAGDEGDPGELVWQRLANFWDRKLIQTSTPTLKGLSKIEAEFLRSDQRRFFLPCPDCGEFQYLEWKDDDDQYRLVWERDREGRAVEGTERYLCRACAVEIEEHNKPWMLANGQWRATAEGETGVVGFHLNALYSPWRRWSAIRSQWERAKGRPERLKVFVNTILGETWEEKGDTPPSLEARREEYAAEVPNGVGVLVGAVDVQDTWLEAKIKGYGDGEESWLIAHHQVHGDPAEASTWLELDDFLCQSFVHESGRSLGVSAVAVDSGGHFTDAVYRFCKARAHRRINAIKGSSVRGKEIISKPTTGNRFRAKLYSVGTDTAKDLVFARMRTNVVGPGYMHLPFWVEEEYLAQLQAEKAIRKYVKGKGTVRQYVPLRERNEALDLEVYCLVALYMLGEFTLRKLGAMADELAIPVDRDPDPADGGAPRRKRSGRRGGWSTGGGGGGGGWVGGWK